MAMNFEKYAQESYSFMDELARNLGHPDEAGRTGIILRAVLHTLRDRITISESLSLISALPMFIKAIYVDNWDYREKPLTLKTRKQFEDEVEKMQNSLGERDFSWNLSTSEIVNTVFNTLRKYIPEGEAEDMISQLPEKIKGMFREKVQQ